jgi:VWFA-related protein
MRRRSNAGREKTSVNFFGAGRIRASLLLFVFLLAVVLNGAPASTQERTRPRRAAAQTEFQSKNTNAPQSGEASKGAQPRKSDGAAPAQTGGAGAQGPEAVDEDEVVTINASEVLLPVTVRDASGQLVSDLTRKDFRVFEDGREQPLSDLSLRQAPVDVALLIDSSSSVAESFEDFRRAVGEFSGRLAEDDRFSLVKFDDRVELLLDWSKSRLQLRRALTRLSTGVFTRFNDALMLSAREQFRKDQRRHALVVLSDGIDSGRGAATVETALRALLESQVTVYVISNTQIERARKQAELDNLLAGPDSSVRFNSLRIGDLREGLRVLDASERNLEQLTGATGGRLYRPQSFDALDRVYGEIADELRRQYALYYTPTNPTRDGRFRRINVEVSGRPFQISTRIGYYAPRR